MQEPFYVSGFLYNPNSEKLLLIQTEANDDLITLWKMLVGEGNNGEPAEATFQRVINECLNLEVKPKSIFPIYDYFDEAQRKTNYVFYAEVRRSPSFEALQQGTPSWVRFSDISKFPFFANTKQDMVVGERVINLKRRIALNIQ
ncbi:hypothetical protein A3H85_03150 [Candidatus Daviesbacteria bacterium RIFCSPLOWO2_02_FULL_40_8]|uniref:Nudix hydrolase domain-containing protein n=1 Tax=Candidatus Daviesbacteria bacterium RIFCSPLOWO2_01_FULL_40_24 TaxID=1797787 RepID=A0A1F5MJ37_9BACT|nr:MAG: hypothetical protein A2780_00295 [Candidatus Daviesbacteria bacterium RIFCSPHIGHO2_01_FULL_41_45]OGE34460.1 MAG: hypothetical protein A3C32_03895 [Candidatus Daviesbacteria bacterium RIFCSPHIGHO2_02_FULL_41_14]OGE65372.1 MAG: hypothetical protein A3B49_00590 [Candidatus Daviesbacteria bacterium RIFCSPLOWO2_01_FULL_40_24]OGE66768.1 MAG: hypothetical protein A3H85_03150 [Candidatus Daviesbacteria bacterium RIFCSPLOWO2_02_FULL_40_8]